MRRMLSRHLYKLTQECRNNIKHCGFETVCEVRSVMVLEKFVEVLFFYWIEINLQHRMKVRGSIEIARTLSLEQ